MKQEKFGTPSDSDRESDYVTGLEDFPDTASKKSKENSSIKTPWSSFNDPCHTSFIQNILYEDSRTEVKVVDLFVAVKRVKDYVDFLSKCNSGLTEKINELHKGSGVIKKEYANLLTNMQELLDKMKADVTVWNILIPRQKSPGRSTFPEHIARTNPKETESNFGRKTTETSQNEQGNKNTSEPDTSTTRSPRCCDVKEIQYQSNEKNKFAKHKSTSACSECNLDSCEKSKVRCLQCLVSSIKEKDLSSQRLIVPEALIGSFLGSLLWFQKERHSGNQASEENKKNNENLNVESAVQMICEILDRISPKPEATDCLSLKSAQETDDDLDWWSGVSCASGSRDLSTSLPLKTTPSGGVADGISSCTGHLNFTEETSAVPKSRYGGRLSVDTTNEAESDFEEALSQASKPSFQCDRKVQSSVNGMGDLTKVVIGKKSASTLTPKTDMLSAWVGKLFDDVRLQIKNLKSKTKVRVAQESFGKSPKEIETSPCTSQLKITANAPVDVFDVTVVQFKKRRHLIGRAMKLKKIGVHGASNTNPSNDPHSASGIADLKDDNWSEDNFQGSDYEFLDACSQSSDDDMEEFLEAYDDKFEKSKKTESLATPPKTTGVLKRAVLKADKAHFFEIHKCYPVYFAQRFEQKWAKTHQSERLELEECINTVNEEVISLNTGEKRQKEVVIQGSSEDLVIFIQVEVEDGSNRSSDGLFFEYQTNSLGTQTREDSSQQLCLTEGKVIKLEKNEPGGESLYHIWSQPEGVKEQDGIIVDESLLMIKKTELEKESVDHEERVVSMKEQEERTVAFSEEVFEREIHELREQENKKKAKEISMVQLVMFKKAQQRVEVWLPQRGLLHRLHVSAPQQLIQEVSVDIIETINANAAELEKALTLIRKIENDIVDVKLGDAISILPQLESELRKHLQSKMKDFGQRNSEIETSIDNFFSAVDFWPDEDSATAETAEFSSMSSEERLGNLLSMLSELEEAVKSNEQSKDNFEVCQFSSTKIYRLLHALTVSIRELEERPSITSLSQTLDIASQLDTAVREYDSIIKRQPFDYVSPERKGRKKRNKSSSRNLGEVPAKQHLKNVRKKVFEIVEDEAVKVEERIERDFDRLDRLEKENDEALMFLEVFLQKTERRVVELENLKCELQELSSSLSVVYENLFKEVKQKEEKEKQRKKEKEANKKEEETQTIEEREEEKEQEVMRQSLQKKESKDRSILTNPSRDRNLEFEENLVRETVSGLLVALDSLKSRAKEKNEVCKGILSSSSSTQEKCQGSEKSSQRSSKSSIAREYQEQLTSSVKEFKRIGHTSLYLSWTKPEGPLKGSVAGYQIHVNGKLNQKVRNPERLQAVLYSIDLSKSSLIELYAVAENCPKILLATVPFQPE